MFEFNRVTSFLAYALVICVLLRLIYTLIVKKWNYFSDRNIVFLRGVPVLGTFFGNINVILGKKSVADSILDVYQKHPDRKFFGIYDIGGVPSFLLRDPDLINKVSIKDFDYFVNHSFQFDKELDPLIGRSLFSMSNQAWRDMRSTLSPLFTGSKMRQMLSLMTECANDFNTCVRNDITSKSKVNNSLEFDMNELMMRLTNDAIGSTAFGIQMNTLKQPDNEFFKMGKEMAYVLQGARALFYLAFPKLTNFFKLKVITNRQDQFFRSVIRSAIEDRQKLKIKRNDMLNLLLLAKEGKLSDENDKESDQDTGFATVSEFMTSKKTEQLKNWTEDDLVAQCIIFFLAGFTGIAMTLCFLFHELAVNMDIQKRLHAEIVEINEELNGEPVTFEALQKMKYLDMTICETLRKYPLALLMDRQTSKQYVLEDYDGTKALLQPNEVVWLPIFGIHRDPKYYPNPELFDPERFSDENKKNIRPGTYIPFGSGPRACIGNRFALLQIKAMAYYILSNFKIECSPRTQIPLKLKGGGMALTVEGGFFNQLKLRI